MSRFLTRVPANAGEMNRLTGRLRAPVPLPPDQRMQAKRLRQLGLDFWEIAGELRVPETAVILALANIRTKRARQPRVSLNVSVAAAEKVKQAQRPGEPIWRTVNRLLGIA